MEQLEGKYFEKTILALKQVKSQENIVLRPQFKSDLRSALLEQIVLQPSKSQDPGWVETVLRFRYLFAGVPVFAALLFVVSNWSSYSVKMPTGQVIPLSNQNQAERSVSSIEDQNAEQQPKLITFPASAVMPPEDALLKAKSRQIDSQPESVSKAVEVHYDKNNVVLQKDLKKTLNNQTENPNKVVSDSLGNITQVNVPQQITTTPTSSTPALTVTPVIYSTQYQRTVESADIQNNTTNSVNAEQPVIVGGETIVSTSPLTEPQTQNSISNLQNSSSVVEQDVKLTQPSQLENNTISVAPIEVQAVQQIDKIQPSATNSVILNSSTVEKSQQNTDLMQVNPSLITAVNKAISLDPARIDFRGERRPEIVAALMKGLSDLNVSLGADYKIVVKALSDGTFKATLTQAGKVKNVFVLGVKDGVLSVVSRVQY